MRRFSANPVDSRRHRHSTFFCEPSDLINGRLNDTSRVARRQGTGTNDLLDLAGVARQKQQGQPARNLLHRALPSISALPCGRNTAGSTGIARPD